MEFALTDGPQPNQLLGLATVPFPGSDEESWSSALGLSLEDTINAFVRLIADEGRCAA